MMKATQIPQPRVLFVKKLFWSLVFIGFLLPMVTITFDLSTGPLPVGDEASFIIWGFVGQFLTTGLPFVVLALWARHISKRLNDQNSFVLFPEMTGLLSAAIVLFGLSFWVNIRSIIPSEHFAWGEYWLYALFPAWGTLSALLAFRGGRFIGKSMLNRNQG